MADDSKRVLLRARVARQDCERITNRAESEGRSVGKLLAIMLRENELLQAQLQREHELLDGALGG